MVLNSNWVSYSHEARRACSAGELRWRWIMLSMARLIILLALAGSAAPLAAQSHQSFSGLDWMNARLATLVRQGTKIEDIRRTLGRYFHDTDVDGGGISETDYEFADAIKLAKERARELGRLLERDLDGDGRITRDEISKFVGPEAKQLIFVQGVRIAPTAEQVRQITEQLIARALVDDKNRDGIVSYEELSSAVTARIGLRSRQGQGVGNRVPLVMDGNGDSVVTQDEFESTLRAALAGLDPDGSGTVSAAEAGAFKVIGHAALRLERDTLRRVHEQHKADALARRCSFPKAAVDDSVHLVGAYTGQAISDVSIGGDDMEIAAARVVIEPGRGSLYVVLTSYDAVVWQFTGAVERVRKVVVQSVRGSSTGGTRSGVAGIARDRVHFSPDAGCVRYFSNGDGTQGVRAAGQLRALAGGALARTIGVHGVATVTLPEGVVSAAGRLDAANVVQSKGPGAPMWKVLGEYVAGGLLSLNPKEVVANKPVARSEMLANVGGLAQLLDRGAIVVVEGVQSFEIMNVKAAGKEQSKRIDHPREFRIIKAMRFPSGLTAAHGVRFLLKKGVPLPQGDPGHACVLSEETGQPIEGSGRC